MIHLQEVQGLKEFLNKAQITKTQRCSLPVLTIFTLISLFQTIQFPNLLGFVYAPEWWFSPECFTLCCKINNLAWVWVFINLIPWSQWECCHQLQWNWNFHQSCTRISKLLTYKVTILTKLRTPWTSSFCLKFFTFKNYQCWKNNAHKQGEFLESIYLT